MCGYMALTLLLSVVGQSSCSPFPLRKYFYFSMEKNWTDARLHCQTHYHDLATFQSMEEVNQLTRPADISYWAWIGLWDHPASWKGTLGSDPNSWRWATAGPSVSSQYHNWAPGEPDYADRDELCVAMLPDGTWADDDCQSARAFLCFTDVGQNLKTYHHIQAPMSWSDAQAYCRQHHTDLPMVLSSEENTALLGAKPAASDIWLALSREPWTWIDGTSGSFRNWRDVSPNGPDYQHCGNENPDHEWDDDECHYLWSFICHEVTKRKTTIKMKVKTSAGLTEAAMDQVLQKVSDALQQQGWRDARVKWNGRPNPTQDVPP